MEKVRPWRGQPSDRGRLKNRTDVVTFRPMPAPLRTTCTNRPDPENSGGLRNVSLPVRSTMYSTVSVCCCRPGVNYTCQPASNDSQGPRPTDTRCRIGSFADTLNIRIKKSGSPYSIAERRVPELIPVPGSQPAGNVSHKPGGRLPLLSARPALTPATLKRAAISFAAW